MLGAEEGAEGGLRVGVLVLSGAHGLIAVLVVGLGLPGASGIVGGAHGLVVGPVLSETHKLIVVLVLAESQGRLVVGELGWRPAGDAAAPSDWCAGVAGVGGGLAGRGWLVVGG